MTLHRSFKAYDVRGRLGTDLTPAIARDIGQAFAGVMSARRVVLGRDCRASSQDLADAVAEGLMAAGVEVLDLGLAGTEEVYFATAHLQACGGIEVTASHNPIEYNGMKFVGRGSAPLDDETQFREIGRRVEAGDFTPAAAVGTRSDASAVRADYAGTVTGFADIAALRPMTILVNAGNGTAGPTFDAIAAELATRHAPLAFVRMHHDPDGSFPHGIPNPLLPENQPVTAEAVLTVGADMGVAWDGDFDRCFFFDETGAFVDGEYVVGLLAEVFLEKTPGAAVVYDPRVVLNTRDIIQAHGGKAISAKTGHVFMKAAMRASGAIYGGELSAHHYFRDFACCDSGMIPWLLVAELMGRTGKPLSALVAERQAAFPSSGEINFRLTDARAAVAAVEAEYAGRAVTRDDSDGMSLEFDGWRFNLRQSNTEPMVRLNVEARGDAGRVATEVAAISALLEPFRA